MHTWNDRSSTWSFIRKNVLCQLPHTVDEILRKFLIKLSISAVSNRDLHEILFVVY